MSSVRLFVQVPFARRPFLCSHPTYLYRNLHKSHRQNAAHAVSEIPSLPIPRTPATISSRSRHQLAQHRDRAVASRDTAHAIKTSALAGDFVEAFRLHREFYEHGAPQSLLPLAPSRLVSSTLIHALLRSGRRFRAAQLVECSWLGSTSPYPSFVDPFHTQTHGPIKLHYKTIEATILELCPMVQSPSSPWMLFATPNQVGAGASAQLAQRLSRTTQELEREQQLSKLESSFLNSSGAHENVVRRRLKGMGSGIAASSQLLKRSAKLDKATGRAVLLLQVARQARHRRTGLMFKALVDSCLLQGEIIIGTLLFVLLVRDWGAQVNLHASSGFNHPSQLSLSSTQHVAAPGLALTDAHVAEVTVATLTSHDTGVCPANDRRYTVPAQTVTEPVSFHTKDPPIAQRPSRKPKLKPKEPLPYQSSFVQNALQTPPAFGEAVSSINPPSDTQTPAPYSAIGRSLLGTLLHVALYPVNEQLQDGTPIRHLHAPPTVDIRFPRPTCAESDFTIAQIARLVCNRELKTLPEASLSLFDSYIKNCRRSGQDWAPVMPISLWNLRRKKRRLAETRRDATLQLVKQAIGASVADEDVRWTLSECYALLRAAYHILASPSAADAILGRMEKLGHQRDSLDTLTVVLEGSIHLRDHRMVSSAIVRIEQLLENGGPVDPRVPLLLYGSSDIPRSPARQAHYEDLQNKLDDKEALVDLIPSGPPNLLNAVMKYFISMGRPITIVQNLDRLLALPYHSLRSRLPELAILAASFGPEFYQSLLNALALDGTPESVGQAERVWQLARTAQADSWQKATKSKVYLHPNGGRTEVKIPAWQLEGGTEIMLKLYAVMKHVKTPRPSAWPAKHSLDTLDRKRVRYEDMNCASTAMARSFEVHELAMRYSEDIEGWCRRLWQTRRSRRGPARVIPSTLPVIDGVDSVYWDRLRDAWGLSSKLVPFQSVTGQPCWSLMKRDGLEYVKAIPYMSKHENNPLLKTLAAEMRERQWYLAEQIPARRKHAPFKRKLRRVVWNRAQSRRIVSSASLLLDVDSPVSSISMQMSPA